MIILIIDLIHVILLATTTFTNPQLILPQINSFPYTKCINQCLSYLIWSIGQGAAVFGVAPGIYINHMMCNLNKSINPDEAIAYGAAV